MTEVEALQESLRVKQERLDELEEEVENLRTTQEFHKKACSDLNISLQVANQDHRAARAQADAYRWVLECVLKPVLP